MDTRKSVAEMIGEGLREFSVLVFVFVSLDNAFHPAPWPYWYAALLGAALGGPPFVVGIALERRRSVTSGEPR
jgi:hypothetical protein